MILFSKVRKPKEPSRTAIAKNRARSNNGHNAIPDPRPASTHSPDAAWSSSTAVRPISGPGFPPSAAVDLSWAAPAPVGAGRRGYVNQERERKGSSFAARLARKRLAASTGPVGRGITSPASRRVQRNRSFGNMAAFGRAQKGEENKGFGFFLRLRALSGFTSHKQTYCLLVFAKAFPFLQLEKIIWVRKWVIILIIIDSCT